MNKITMRFLMAVCVLLASCVTVFNQSTNADVKIATAYDRAKDKTTVRMSPFKISGDKDKYHSLHMAPSYSYTGSRPPAPSIIDCELQTVVKGKLHIDLYVVFIVDGETIVLSSNRWAVKRPVPGRRWRGERMVFRMPHETLMKLAEAKTVEIKMDVVKFDFGEPQKQAIRDFAKYIDLISTRAGQVEIRQLAKRLYLRETHDRQPYSVGYFPA